MLKLGLAQINPTVGDLNHNKELILKQIQEAKKKGVQLLIFPELAVCGYPPEDLLLRDDFLFDCQKTVEEIALQVETDMVVLLGFPEFSERGPFNAAAVLFNKQIQNVYRKMHLPNYGVFDEKRYFRSGNTPAILKINDITVGVTICEDIWEPGAPLNEEALAGANVIANLSASPFEIGKAAHRESSLLRQRAKDNQSVIAYCNMVGGQDELVFDGGSLVVNHMGDTIARAPQFEESLTVVTVDNRLVRQSRLRDTRRYTLEPGTEITNLGDFVLDDTTVTENHDSQFASDIDQNQEVYSALVTGLRDYTHKNGFKHVVLGLSGGIDSALVALVAYDALGKDNVTCVVMPSKYSSDETQNDARRMGDLLGVDTREIPIETVYGAFEQSLATDFEGTEADVTEENLQARIRGTLLMSLSNKFGWLLLTTGNKSEMSVGYSTLYGDMCGGFAVIKDVPKLLVYELTEWRNKQAGGNLVPQDIITREPSAELRNDQKDSDSLPDYDILDPVLDMYVEKDASIEQIIDQGYNEADVRRVVRLVDLAEYKRRQAPPGIKVTSRAFGKDRRQPITNSYRPDQR